MMSLLCLAAPCCSNSQIHLRHTFWYFSRSPKAFKVTCVAGGANVSGFPYGTHLPKVSISTEGTSSFFSQLAGKKKLFSQSMGYMDYVENTAAFASEKELTYLSPDINALSQGVDGGSTLSLEPLNNSSVSVTGSIRVDIDLLSNLRNKIKDVVSDVNDSVGTSVSGGKNALNSSIDGITSSITDTIEGTNKAVDALIGKVISSIDQTGEFSRKKLISLPGDLLQGSSKVGIFALDLLRQTIIAVEDYLVKGIELVNYSYGSFKELLPPEVQSVLDISEEQTREFSRPVGMAFQQVFTAIDGLEASLGLDPSDPLIHFAFLIGAPSVLWVVYWRATYGGYAGDLSPDLTLELLSREADTILIDVRPEDLRDRDGIPDLRRAARFRYANVFVPEVDGKTRNLLNSGKDLDDTLTAVVIRNLKNIQDRSKIIIMDSDGTRSKGIARSLWKLGFKRSYRVQGGFNSWVNQGLRIKEVKIETALTILNELGEAPLVEKKTSPLAGNGTPDLEEAEAILEDLRPSPLQLFGVVAGSMAGLYALLEWEKSLQLIGAIGIGQTIYQRLDSYKDYKDLQEDLRLLLVPIRLAAQAISWATGKKETNGLALATSPSSTDVQSRVLQAAAKHESQPSDADETQDSSLESTTLVNENTDPPEE